MYAKNRQKCPYNVKVKRAGAQLAILTIFASSVQLSSLNHKLASARLSSACQFQENFGSARTSRNSSSFHLYYNVIHYFRRLVNKSKADHDFVFWNTNLNHSDFQYHRNYKIRQKPYFPKENTTFHEISLKQEFDAYNSNFDNLAENFTHAPLADHANFKSMYFLRERTQKLCRDTVTS